ncbi:NAD(P)-dependent oxidoreductase [Nonomuraea pusilla]|uniref:NAD(P)-binding domain-containing protein n=1 Tax=Nonomuraea pusilla TaxID=46177 RepID=A0A1H7UKT0_9ACTN|nr:NAD(P)H-binding protein [Nonomuraea pusilla]SEL97551.1 hypothetical protein SAMN05660976_03856 [Nonomuraea pusilla]
MSRIVVFGAGGRAGRRVVAEAAGRGHEVTAVVRSAAAHPGLAAGGVRVVEGDVTDEGSVAAAAQGHDVAVQTTARMDVPSEEFYGAATRALIGGLAEAGVRRLVAVGIGTLLEVSPGVRLLDTPGFPADARAFSLGHAAELDLLRGADGDLDWVVLAPPPVVLDDEAPRTGTYRIGDGRVTEGPFSYADLAVALVDEAEQPRHHRVQVSVSP